ncbi:hypothetical protein PR048_011708 [Dryococelus australis]|uniref:Mutator-like transposase domain-containing protein n=1 Tax=Dryococelus australis TaxID=614101 RepID=A0ABQ9HMA5_9NEOP|nr:hypothetical protein PR048_011708 [Dryococelus australis]
MSKNRENNDTYIPINETAVHSILVTGGGYSQRREFSAGILETIDNAALQFMLDAAEEEKAVAIRDGNVESDGVPMCTVVSDEAWCKRNYKTNYDSLSGVLRNYCHKLTDPTKNTKFPVTSRNILKQKIPRFRTAVDKAI